MLKPGQVIEVQIDRLAGGGDGVGRLKDGKVVFVPFSAPGDTVSIEITESKKSFYRAKILKILTPGASRREPICPVFGKCGGCTWQHINYSTQIQEKQNIVQYALRKFDIENFNPTQPNSDEFHYRNRIQVVRKNAQTHFRKRNSHELVEFKECYIAEPKINDILNSDDLPQEGDFEIGISRDDKPYIRPRGTHDPNSRFSQVNTKQNKVLLERVRTWVQKMNFSKSALELFAGNGNFTQVLAEFFNKVIAVEISRPSVESLKKLNHENIEAVCADVSTYQPQSKQIDLLFLDPPRTGVSRSFFDSTFHSLQFQYFIYVSCDPMTLSRDLEQFVKKGQHIYEVQTVDMFPQTDHVETLVLGGMSPRIT